MRHYSKFKANMSKNKAEMFQDEMDLVPPLAIAVVDARESGYSPRETSRQR